MYVCMYVCMYLHDQALGPVFSFQVNEVSYLPVEPAQLSKLMTQLLH